jgi:hypothetical protein
MACSNAAGHFLSVVPLFKMSARNTSLMMSDPPSGICSRNRNRCALIRVLQILHRSIFWALQELIKKRSSSVDEAEPTEKNRFVSNGAPHQAASVGVGVSGYE